MQAVGCFHDEARIAGHNAHLWKKKISSLYEDLKNN
jgi:hypothetical protein